MFLLKEESLFMTSQFLCFIFNGILINAKFYQCVYYDPSVLNQAFNALVSQYCISVIQKCLVLVLDRFCQQCHVCRLHLNLAHIWCKGWPTTGCTRPRGWELRTRWPLWIEVKWVILFLQWRHNLSMFWNKAFDMVKRLKQVCFISR